MVDLHHRRPPALAPSDLRCVGGVHPAHHCTRFTRPDVAGRKRRHNRTRRSTRTLQLTPRIGDRIAARVGCGRPRRQGSDELRAAGYGVRTCGQSPQRPPNPGSAALLRDGEPLHHHRAVREADDVQHRSRAGQRRRRCGPSGSRPPMENARRNRPGVRRRVRVLARATRRPRGEVGITTHAHLARVGRRQNTGTPYR